MNNKKTVIRKPDPSYYKHYLPEDKEEVRIISFEPLKLEDLSNSDDLLPPTNILIKNFEDKKMNKEEVKKCCIFFLNIILY